MTSVSRCLLLPSLLLLVVNATTAAEYQIIDLGPLEGGVGSAAFGLNDHGEAVGVSYLDMNGNIANSLPIRWGVGGAADKLWEGDGWSQYGGARPQAINNAGQIVGQAQNNPYTGTPLPTPGVPDGVAFFWDAGGGRKELGTLEGSNSMATALTESGQVAGTSDNLNGDARAFVWDAAGGMRDLGTLGGVFSFGNAINESGQIAGYAADASGNERAFLWDAAGGMRDLGTLGGQADESRAFGLNNIGDVVGYSRVASGQIHACLWDDTGLFDLGVPKGGGYTEAYDINSSRQVVGTVGSAGTGEYAAIWTTALGWRALDDLAHSSDWQLKVAWAINDSGVIVGRGTLNDQMRAFAAVPVPEPKAAMLFAFGAIFSSLIFGRSERRLPRTSKGIFHVTQRRISRILQPIGPGRDSYADAAEVPTR